MMDTNSLPKAGRMFLMAWGMMTSRMLCIRAVSYTHLVLFFQMGMGRSARLILFLGQWRSHWAAVQESWEFLIRGWLRVIKPALSFQICAGAKRQIPCATCAVTALWI